MENSAMDQTVVRLMIADLVSTTGTEMTAVALPWFVLQTTGSAAQTGLVLSMELLGLALCGLPGGRVVLRLGARKTMLLADGLRAPALVAVPVLHSLGLLRLPVLLVVAFVLGAPFAAHQAARQQALVGIVGADERAMTRLGGVMSAANESASAIGPALGGILIASLGTESVLLLDSLSYATAVVLVARALPRATGDGGPGIRTLDGVRWLRRAQGLRRTVGGLCVLQISFTASLVALPVLARETYHGGSTLAGLLLAAYGAGSVAGGLLAAWSQPHVAATGIRIMALALLPLVFTPPASVLAGCLFLNGLGSGLVFPLLFARLSVRPPEQVRAAAQTATTTALSVLGPVGALASGLLLEAGGAPTTALLFVAGSAVLGAFIAGSD